MSGEVCVVTGATSGIGKATAAALAGRGAQVVLVARDRGRGEAAAAELAAAGGPAPRLEVADLASMGQVRALADRLGTLERIDVLVNNAGLMAVHRSVPGTASRDLPGQSPGAVPADQPAAAQAGRSRRARVVTVSSDAHAAARLDLDDLQLKHG